MSDDKQIATKDQAAAPVRKRTQHRSDGSDGPPLIIVPPGAVSTTAKNTAGAANSALKEEPAEGDGYTRDHEHAAHLVVLDAQKGLVAQPHSQPARKKIAVVGFASSSRRYVPVHDPTWEIWGLNQLYRHIPRADRWFDIHHNWNEEVVPGTDHHGWIRDCGIPVYMMHTIEGLPTSVRFPIEMLIQTYGADYFTSTIAYMVALAVWEIDQAVAAGLHAFVKKTPKSKLSTYDLLAVAKSFYNQHAIGIFGVDLVVQEEYFWQKACAEFWCGHASAKGINLIIPPESALCKQQVRYGYAPELKSVLEAKELAEHQKEITAQRDELLKKIMILEGAAQCNDRWRQVIELRQRGATVA